MMNIIVDTREQLPLFEGVKDTLKTGDYSIKGYETEMAIERKSVPDAVSSVTRDRKRFQDEMERAKELKFFAIVIEGTIEDLMTHIRKEWAIHNNTKELKEKNKGYLFGQVKAVPNTYIHWSVQYGYPVYFCKDRNEAKRVVLELLTAYEKYKSKGVI